MSWNLGANWSERASRVLALLFVVESALNAGQTQTSFPGSGELRSPDGNYAVDSVDSATEPYHALYLKQLNGRQARKVMSFERHVDVFWSKDGRHLVINNHLGSDLTTCAVFAADGRTPQVDLMPVLSQQKELTAHLRGNHHVRIEGIGWNPDSSLRVRISGYGEVDPSGFTRMFDYVLGKGLRLATNATEQPTK